MGRGAGGDPSMGTVSQGLRLVGQIWVVEIGSVDGPGNEPNLGAIQGVQTSEKMVQGQMQGWRQG